ncbi:NUDIX hydrolase [Alkalihalobacillus sp. LMS39]|uniref:NUDIX hydrolase n=1 Tax=Alkalihalobacillus sp. LMS39 TaxID=2924032 RepID=UPI001FB313B8|nr:NUDIX hydrolase [Alkalihalobacillus sp. LMS39]UOE95053.1 NUDIX hydrolase [Alkalihalobacillus sp. LMS39]
MAEYIKEIRELIGNRPFILVGSTIVVLNDNKEILFQHRSDTEEWGLPGESMEIGETLEQTAARELYEETGLKAKTLKFVDVMSGKELYFKYPNGDEVYNVISIYLAEGINGKLAMNDSENLALNYFSLNNPPSKMDERAKIIIKKYFL